MLIRTSKDKNNPYVIIHKGFLEDMNLSLKAKGLLAYCMSKPDDWEFHVDQLAESLKEGVEAIYSGFKELIEAGYCLRNQARNEKSKFSKVEYTLHEQPIQIILPQPGFTDADVTDAGVPKAAPYIQLKNEDTNKRKIFKKKGAEKDRENFTCFGKYVKLPDEEYRELCVKYGADRIDRIIDRMNDYIPNAKPYKDYAAAIRQWIRNEAEQNRTIEQPSLSAEERNERIEKNRKFCEAAENKIKNKCNGYVHFTAYSEKATLVNTNKGLNKDFAYSSMRHEEFKKELIIWLENNFPKR